MTIKRYTCKIDYTEHTVITTDVTVYARSPEDAESIARMQFLDRRRDHPTITKVTLTEINRPGDGK